MKVCRLFTTIVVSTLWITHRAPAIEAKPVGFLPLTARDVYRVLHAVGQEDIVPEGRIVTQGIAAIGGFALGLTKALSAVFVYDVITANVTGLEGIGDVGSAISASTSEICFNTRSARSLNEAEAIAQSYIRMDEQEDAVRVRDSGARRKTKRNRGDRTRIQQKVVVSKPEIETDTATGTGTDTGTGTSAATSPTAITNPSDSTGTTRSETMANTGTGTATLTSSTTSAANAGATNCIVIQKRK